MRAALLAAAALLTAGAIPTPDAPGLSRAPAAAASPPVPTRVAMLDDPPQSTPPSDSAIEARTREIASGLRCVVCQGLSVEDSPAELAREMRAIVREQVAAGRSREEVEAYFVDRYGEFVLLEPRPEGFNLLVYVLPVAALLGGALFVLLFVRRWSGEESAETTS